MTPKNPPLATPAQDEVERLKRVSRAIGDAAAAAVDHNVAEPYYDYIARAALAALSTPQPAGEVGERKFALGQRVRKTKGSSWQGHVVGFYATALTPIGYAVESERELGSVQIYPESALIGLPAGGEDAS